MKCLCYSSNSQLEENWMFIRQRYGTLSHRYNI
nr:MAG TPA: hypothetical protein [Caudoviricetes sp.]